MTGLLWLENTYLPPKINRQDVMSSRHTAASLFAIILLCSTTLHAKTPPRLGAGASFGFGGEYRQLDDGSGDEDMDMSEQEPADMAPSVGALLQFRYTLIDYVSLGVRPTFLAFRSQAEADNERKRSYALDTNAFLQLQFEFGAKHNLFYLGGFGGPAFTFPSKDLKEPVEQLGLELRAGRAWNYGAMIGVNLQGARKDPGLFIEASYLTQQVAYNVTGDITNPFTNESEPVDEKSTGQFWQIGLNVGVTFALPN